MDVGCWLVAVGPGARINGGTSDSRRSGTGDASTIPSGMSGGGLRLVAQVPVDTETGLPEGLFIDSVE